LVVCGAYCYYRRKPVAEEDISGYHELKDVKPKGTNLDGNGLGALEHSSTSTQEAAAGQHQKVMYRVCRNVKIGLHEDPDSNSMKTGKELAYGEIFEVDERKVVTTEEGKTQTFLHMVTGGWAFQFHPTDGTSIYM
jgi:hypothetical protein